MKFSKLLAIVCLTFAWQVASAGTSYNIGDKLLVNHDLAEVLESYPDGSMKLHFYWLDYMFDGKAGYDWRFGQYGISIFKPSPRTRIEKLVQTNERGIKSGDIVNCGGWAEQTKVRLVFSNNIAAVSVGASQAVYAWDISGCVK